MIHYGTVSWTVHQYVTPDGHRPYGEWLDTLPLQAQARIAAGVARFEAANLGDHKQVGGGVWEARLPFGPGYRLYFGKHRRQVLLLLLQSLKSRRPSRIPPLSCRCRMSIWICPQRTRPS